MTPPSEESERQAYIGPALPPTPAYIPPLPDPLNDAEIAADLRERANMFIGGTMWHARLMAAADLIERLLVEPPAPKPERP